MYGMHEGRPAGNVVPGEQNIWCYDRGAFFELYCASLPGPRL